MSICGVYMQSAIVTFTEFPIKLSRSRRSVELRVNRKPEFPFIPKVPILRILPHAAASSSAAANSEQVFGAREKQKRQIAGIEQDELLEPAVLADPDSCFSEFKGVQIHHKICDAESQILSEVEGSGSQSLNPSKRMKFPMILLHGFGASVFSWNRAMKPLARLGGSKVLAFDRPAFGLTSRPNPGIGDTSRPLNPYSILFSVLATLHFIDFLAAEKAILVGHSAGSLVAVEAYFKAPERVAALILVAPAIVAPFTSPKVAKDDQTGEKSYKEDEKSKPGNQRNVFTRIFSSLSKLTKYVAETIIGMAKGMGAMLNSLYRKALSAFLRSAIGVMLLRMIIDKFGVPAVRNSWYDPKQVTDHILQGYTKPLRVKGWDRALVEFTVAMLTDTGSGSKPPLPERLSEISCPVLIITGDSDRLVPAWNSERLSRAIPGSCFETIKNSGHLPHEEKVEEFISIVDRFLERVFGGLEEPSLQAVT